MASIHRFRDKWKVYYRCLGIQRVQVLNTRKEAQRVKAEIELALSQDIDPRTNRPIFDGYGITTLEAQREFKIWSKTKGRADSTLKRDKSHVLPFLSQCPEYLFQVSPEHCKQYMSKDFKTASTYNKALAGLRAFFRAMREKGHIKEYPTESIKRRKEPRKLPTVFTPEEVVQLISGLPEYMRVCGTFIAVTGCRLGESLNLKWTDLSLPRVLIQSPKEKHDKYLVIPKSLCDEILALPHVCEFVFTGKQGRKISKRFIQRKLKDSAKKAKIDSASVNWHKFRHTVASRLIQTLPSAVVQRMLGHSSIQTTERYIAVAGKHLEHAADHELAALAAEILGNKSG